MQRENRSRGRHRSPASRPVAALRAECRKHRPAPPAIPRHRPAIPCRPANPAPAGPAMRRRPQHSPG
ncbi:MAG TPA: hypothetical protein DCX71_07085 [Erythrobacter sp.]|nr:hypothetical protein [Erythrobacter sp.]HAV80848.1 hypothetical protein [Erythrobacter sp.]HAW35839.1 hypothetical protein [Erythrobacter sp.]HBK16458.1 hypothetical protein [Erythrobacter sp.]HCI62262.1 hypothetical protein [Erythrobacter sp.]